MGNPFMVVADEVIHGIPGSGHIVNEELVDRHHLEIVFNEQEGESHFLEVFHHGLVRKEGAIQDDGVGDTVDQAIKELGYFPNNAARSLVKKQTDSIAILLRNIHDPFFTDLIRGIEDASASLGRNIIFCSPGKDEKVRDRYIEYLTNGISDAIILYGSLFTDLSLIHI